MKRNGVITVGHNVLAGLTVEELEQRLEMQMLSVTEADWCLIDRPPVCNCFGEYDCGAFDPGPIQA